MKAIICDQCRKSVLPDSYELAPAGQGWIHVTPRDTPGSQDYCSATCLIAALTPPPVPVSDVERAIEGHALASAAF
jgi:hypothetical protein